MVLVISASVLMCLCAAPATQAQQATVNIRVTESSREEALDRAEVRLHTFAHPAPSQRGYTDGNGRVIFYGVARGSYYLEVEKDGYEAYREQIDVSSGLSENFFVRMRPKDLPARNAPTGTVSAAALIPGPARKAYEDGMAKLKDSPSESIPLFRRAVELYPKFPEAWAMLGLAYLREKNNVEAKAALQKAVELNPRYATPQVLLGKIWMEERDFPAAEKRLLEAQRLDPQAWDAPYELARCYFNMGQMEKALESARKAQSLPEASTSTHLLLADILLRRGERSEALKELEEFVRVDAQSPFAERVRAKIAQLKKP